MTVAGTGGAPPVLGLLAHDLRWKIVGMLAASDFRAGELVARTGQAPSLVSYHLGRLRDAGLLTVRRSAADGRDAYYALDLDALSHALDSLAARIHRPAPPRPPFRCFSSAAVTARGPPWPRAG
jgi:DNA-binding transcriptional ArsR family regulator